MLNLDSIKSQLTAAAQKAVEDIIVLSTVDSTNTYVLNLLKTIVADKSLVCIAANQTQGRGRHGKQWVSPKGNLYFSLSWPCQHLPAQVFSALSVVVGIAVAQMLENMGVQEIKLKWPNDILWHGRKLGGILLDSIGTIAQPTAVVIGIGLNIVMPVEIEEEINQPFVDLTTILAQPVTRETVAAALINQLVEFLSILETQGAATLLAKWPQYDALAGQPITVKTKAQILHGIARGITQSGQLCLEASGQLLVLSSAEILECRTIMSGE